MSKTIIESLIPFITNMMNNQKEVRESGEPVIDLRGVKFLIKEPHPANLDIPDVQFWYSLVGSDASAVSKVKCTFKSHWIEPTESVENITWYDEIVWEFSAHNNSLVANCDSMNAMDSSTADVSGTVSELCYSDRGDVEEYHEEDIKANLLYELYDIAIDDFSGYGDDFAVDTCEAELTLGARTLTVPVVCELDRIFTGEISSAERYPGSVRFYGNDIEYADVFNPTADLYQDDTLLGTLSVQYVDKGFLTTPSVSNDSPELGWIENCNRAVIHIGNYEHTINEIEEYYEPQE